MFTDKEIQNRIDYASIPNEFIIALELREAGYTEENFSKQVDCKGVINSRIRFYLRDFDRNQMLFDYKNWCKILKKDIKTLVNTGK